VVVTARQTLFVTLGLLALAACGGETLPTSPSMPTEVSSSLRPVSLSIAGAASLDHPEATGQLTATVTFSDHTSRDVTAEASWAGVDEVIGITGPGVIKAVRYGTGTVSASYRGVSASIWIRVAPAGAFLIAGSVRSEDGFRLVQARVEFSSRCGTHTTTTDVFGGYVLPAEGQATMRVERGGFRPQIKQVMVGEDGQVDFQLQHVEVAGDLTGTYRLIVTASTSCHLPPEVMQRSYDASILDIPPDLLVLLSGANMVAWAGEPGFTGSRNQSTVRFDVRDTFDDGYNFIERIDPGRDLYYSGTATGVANPARIVATFSGRLRLQAYGGGMIASCDASDHRFEFTRSASR
jgi:Carboxypeptidase regulatory-like domain